MAAIQARLFVFFCIVSWLAFSSCHPNSRCLDVNVTCPATDSIINSKLSAFPPFSKDELKEEWAKEAYLGICFARELDFYRAITCFKRANHLLPKRAGSRRSQIEYSILQCYYLAGKFQDAADFFEASSLIDVCKDFPAFHDLLIMMHDAYLQIDQEPKTCRILKALENQDAGAANASKTAAAIAFGNFPDLMHVKDLNKDACRIDRFLSEYAAESKSVSKAQTLNALLPGAGYYYVGQKKTALTSFLINALFIAAAYEFFDRGYAAAGIITTSLEMGWYFGGINGAGLAAKEYNQRLYEAKASELLFCLKLFPVLRLEASF